METLQKYVKIYDYIYEFQKLLYDYYSKTVVSFLVTYYHLNYNESVMDKTKLSGGYYERIGELSGIKWDKILLLPIYYPEELQTQYSGEEYGYVNEGTFGFVIPDSYGFTPVPNDVVFLDQTYIQPKGRYSIYTISGVEKSTPGDKAFWKLKADVEQSRTADELDLQLSGTYTFFEYTKHIYTLDKAAFMTKLLLKHEQIRKNMKSLFDENSGFYLV